MTKIRIDDGKGEEKTTPAASTKKTVRKIPIEHVSSHPVSSSATHTSVQKSTTLSRRYVKKPVAKSTTTPKAAAPKVSTSKVSTPKSRSTTFARIAAKQTAKKERAASRLAEKRLRAEKEQAARAAKIEKAKAEKRLRTEREQAARAAKLAKAKAEKAAKLAKKQTALKQKTEVKAAKNAAKTSKISKKTDRALKSVSTATKKLEAAETSTAPKLEHTFKKKHKARHIFFALLCSGATVGALVAFVHFSIPDLSVRVAAFQTGIDAAYPTFVPRGYSLSGVTSDKDDVVTITFNGPDGAFFTLSEEKSTWDSTALLNNYVKKNYPSDFTTLREQGITIYVRGEKASWVNGGMLYKIEATGKYLTKEQIRNIATSL